jgi:hypothetical protein
MPRARLQQFGSACIRQLRGIRTLTERERDHLVSEMAQIRDLMPLLMKQRNGAPWSTDDRAELRRHLTHLKHISPYIVLTLVPGSFIALPMLAWWLDRRRHRAMQGRFVNAVIPSRESDERRV